MSTVDGQDEKAAQDGKTGQPPPKIELKKDEPVKTPVGFDSQTMGLHVKDSPRPSLPATFKIYQHCNSPAADSDTSTLIGASTDEEMESFSDIKVEVKDHGEISSPQLAIIESQNKLANQLHNADLRINDEPLVEKIKKISPSHNSQNNIQTPRSQNQTANKNQMVNQITSGSQTHTPMSTPKRKPSDQSPSSIQNKRQCLVDKPTYSSIMQTQIPQGAAAMETDRQSPKANRPQSYVAYILPKNHQELSQTQAGHIRDSLIGFLYPPTASSSDPVPAKFIKYGLTQAMFKITCADSESVEWVINTTPKIPEFEGSIFCSYRGNELPKLVTMTTHYPRKKGGDLANIKHRLQRSNPNLNIESWKIYWGYVKENTLQILYGIPENEVEKLKENNYHAFFELSTVVFTHTRYIHNPPGTGNIHIVRVEGDQTCTIVPSQDPAQPPNTYPNKQSQQMLNPKKHKSSQNPHKRQATGAQNYSGHSQNRQTPSRNSHGHKPDSHRSNNQSNMSHNPSHKSARAAPPPISHRTPVSSPKSGLVPLMGLKIRSPGRRPALLPDPGTHSHTAESSKSRHHST